MQYIENPNDEKRCEYLVTAKRKRLWEKELKIYDYFNKVCEKYNLKHFLIYGSVLGAIRHNGFIPWDDDIDVGMLRDDFDRFLEIADKEFFGDYSVVYGLAKHSFNTVLRIRDKSTTGFLRKDIGESYNKGVFLEVYPYDSFPSSEDSQKSHIREVVNSIDLLKYKYHPYFPKSKSDLVLLAKTIFKSKIKLFDEYIDCCKKYNNKNEMLVNLVSVPIYATGEAVIEKKYLKEIIQLPFENTSAFVIKNYDLMLKTFYKSYMELPPVEERGRYHDNIVFYDPDKPYTEYENNEIINKFFNGEIENEL